MRLFLLFLVFTFPQYGAAQYVRCANCPSPGKTFNNSWNGQLHDAYLIITYPTAIYIRHLPGYQQGEIKNSLNSKCSCNVSLNTTYPGAAANSGFATVFNCVYVPETGDNGIKNCSTVNGIYRYSQMDIFSQLSWCNQAYTWCEEFF